MVKTQFVRSGNRIRELFDIPDEHKVGQTVMTNIKRIERSVPIKRVSKMQPDRDYSARYKNDANNKKKDQKLNNSNIDEFV